MNLKPRVNGLPVASRIFRYSTIFPFWACCRDWLETQSIDWAEDFHNAQRPVDMYSQSHTKVDADRRTLLRRPARSVLKFIQEA